MAEVFVAEKLLSGQFGVRRSPGVPPSPSLKLMSAMTASVATLTSEEGESVASFSPSRSDYV